VGYYVNIQPGLAAFLVRITQPYQVYTAGCPDGIPPVTDNYMAVEACCKGNWSGA